MELSDEQQRVLGDAIEVVSACPGAGKTRALVARFIQEADSSPKGVALVSFTNAAVDEIALRLKPYGNFSPPDFVGTFDRFVHQFLVTPYVLRTAHLKPRYVDSWNDLGDADWLYLRDRSVQGRGIALADFVPGTDGELSLSPSPSADTRTYMRQLEKAGISVDSITSRAKAAIGGLLANHIYDCDHARLLALDILSGVIDDPGPRRMKARFSEVIIDEFQDCSDIEYQIRERLRSLGIKVVVVADADQGIYEFRNAKPQMFAVLTSGTVKDAVVELDDNYRSSRAICALVTSLRALSKRTVAPKRDFGGTEAASNVYVLVGSEKYKLDTFRALAEEHGITEKDSIILAPSRKQAAALAGDVSTKFAKGYGATGALLVVLAQLRIGRLSRLRNGAIARFTGLVLAMFDWASVQLDRATVEEKLEHLELQPEVLRLSLSRLVRESARWSSKDNAKVSIQATITALVSQRTMQPATSVATRFPKPRDDDWASWTVADEATRVVTDHSHIHNVKGKEFPAVLLDLPHRKVNGVDSGFTCWLADVDSETRRVLYVGASRAERLLALSVAKTKADDIVTILERDGVPYKIMKEEES